MGHVRTSAIFYHRGIPNSRHSFGAFALANFVVPQPTSLFVKGYRSNQFNDNFRTVVNYR